MGKVTASACTGGACLSAAARRIGRVLGHSAFPWLAALLAMALALPSLRSGFQSDDQWHRAAMISPPGLETAFEPGGPLFRLADGHADRTRHRMSLGLLPWWSVEDFRFWFWRPVSEWTHRLDTAWWPGHSGWMHLHSVLWYGGWVLCVAFLFRRLIPTAWMAGLAALCFAVDYGHALAATWLAARCTAVCALFGALCLLLHAAARRRSAPVWGMAAALALGVAFLSKESAVAVCGYLLAYAVFLDGGSVRERLRSLWPYAVVFVAWQTAYRLGGYGAAGSDIYFDPARNPWGLIRVTCERAPILLLGQWGLPPAEAVWLLGPAGRAVLWSVAVIVMAALIGLMLPLLRTDRRARFFFAGMLLAVVPAGLGMVSSRQLEFVGLGAAGLLALLVGHLIGGFRSGCAPTRATALLVLPMLLGIHLIAAPVIFVMTHRYFVQALAVQTTALTQPALMDPGLGGRTVVLVNPPFASDAAYLLIHRALTGRSRPAHVWALAPGRNAVQPVRVRRLDAASLEVGAPGGVPVDLQRSRENPLRVGQRIELDGMTVTIAAVDGRRFPTAMIFVFPEPLESAALVWFRAAGGRFVPWTPPAVGSPPVDLP